MPTSATRRGPGSPGTGNVGTEGRIAHGRGALPQFLATGQRGSPVAGEPVGNGDRDCGRDCSRRPGPAVGPRPEGEAPARQGDQDRHTRRPGAEPAATGRDAPLATARPAPGGDERSLRAARAPGAPPHRPPPAGAAPSGPPRRAAWRSGTSWRPRSRASRSACAWSWRPPGTPAPPDAPRGRGGLAVVILLELGDLRRFPRAAHLAASAGPTPRVHARGGRTRSGPSRGDIHRSRTWAVLEAARTPCRPRPTRPPPHVSRRSACVPQRPGRAPLGGSHRWDPAQAGTGPATRRRARRRPRRDQRAVPRSARRSASACDVPPGQPPAALPAEIGGRCHRPPGPAARERGDVAPSPTRCLPRPDVARPCAPPSGALGREGGWASSDRHFI